MIDLKDIKVLQNVSCEICCNKAPIVTRIIVRGKLNVTFWICYECIKQINGLMMAHILGVTNEETDEGIEKT